MNILKCYSILWVDSEKGLEWKASTLHASAGFGEFRGQVSGRHAVLHLGVGDGTVLLAQVKTQLAFVTEMQVTLLAMVRFLSRVDSQVALQSLKVPETGATDFTGIGLLASVDEHVGTEVGHLYKSGSAGFAFVGLLSRVNSSMGFQIGWPVELGPTDITTIGFLTRVDGLVAGEVALVAEGGLAPVTLVGFVTVGLQRVPLEGGLLREAAVTLIAEEGPILTAGIRVLRLGLSHLLRERGAGGVEAHLRVLRGLRAAGRALGGVQVEWRVALAAAAGGACQGPVDDVIEPAGLRDGGVLPIGTELSWGLEVKVLGLHGWLAGWGCSVGSRGEAAQLSLLGPLWFSILVEAVEHDELVFLPVAGFGVSGALGWRGARGLEDAGILAAAGLRGRVGLAVGLLGALWTNQTLPVQGGTGGLEMQSDLILRRGSLFLLASLVTGEVWGIPGRGSSRLGTLGHTVVHVTPCLLWGCLLGRVDVAVAHTVGQLHGRPTVLNRDWPGTIAGERPLLGERIGHRHPGIPQLLIGKEEAADREVAVHGIGSWRCGQATVQAGGKGSALTPGGIPQRQAVLHHLTTPIGHDVLGHQHPAVQELFTGRFDGRNHLCFTGLDKLPAGVHDMLHLQVHGCGHHSHDVALPQVEPRGVHEVQEDAEPLGVDLWIQIDYTKVAFQLVCEDAVEQATAGHEDCLMSSKLLTAHHYDNISQDVTAPEAIEIEKNVTGMAGELDTAVSWRGHFVFTQCLDSQSKISLKTSFDLHNGPMRTQAGVVILL